MIDLSFHYSPDFIGIIPILRFHEIVPDKYEGSFSGYMYTMRPAFGRNYTGFSTKTLAMCFSSRLVHRPISFLDEDKLERWYTAS